MKTISTRSAVILALILSACSGDTENLADGQTGKAGQTTQPARTTSVRVVRVETIDVKPQPFDDIIALLGVVKSPNDASLSAQSIGTLISRKPLGAVVAKGDIVARIDATLIEAVLGQVRASFEAAQAETEFAEDTFERQKPLYQDSIISALEFEQLRTQLNASRAQLARTRAVVTQTEKQLKNTVVEAPFPGTIEEHFAEIGEHVSIGTPVLRIVDTKTLKVIAGVPERYARDIHVGTAVTLKFKAYGSRERSGETSFVGSVIDPENRSFMIEILLDNAEGFLKPAMVADVYLAREKLTDQIVIPQTAVLRDETGNSVYIVTHSAGGLLAERRTIETGPSFGGNIVISSGLIEGDKVIVTGQTRVTEGDLVETSL